LAAAHFYLCTGQLRTCSPSFGFTVEKKTSKFECNSEAGYRGSGFFYNKRFHYQQQEAISNLTEFKVTE
jgi:hypothetical protein